MNRNWLVAADYSGAELRMIALLAGDEPLMTAFKEGKDVHAQNARDLFRCSEEQSKTKQFRNPAKTFVYALNYSTDDEEIAAHTILSRIQPINPQVTFEDVYAAVQSWWSAHPKIREFKQRTWAKVLSDDYVECDLSGRRRKFYGRPKDTEAYNYKLQAGCGHLINQAILGVDEELTWVDEALLLQRHDELICEGPDWKRLARILKKHMTRTVEFDGRTMLFPVDISIGKRWGAFKEVHLDEGEGND